tara:strand:+ start:788 stop:949 length:162 start_codon:yes stop_codon:yes gene_type:complete
LEEAGFGGLMDVEDGLEGPRMVILKSFEVSLEKKEALCRQRIHALALEQYHRV